MTGTQRWKCMLQRMAKSCWTLVFLKKNKPPHHQHWNAGLPYHQLISEMCCCLSLTKQMHLLPLSPVCCACWLSFFSPFKPFFLSPLHPQSAAALAHLGGIRLEHSKRPTTRTSNGPFHFYPYRAIDATIQGMRWVVLWLFFPGISISRYIFPGGS